jgi:hypothetical protein
LEFTPDEVDALAKGTLVDVAFLGFDCPAHLQMTATLVLEQSALARQWVEEKTFLANGGPSVAQLSPEKHTAAVRWLRAQGMPTASLLFWAVRDNFRRLYDMMVCNSFNLSLVLSQHTIGLVFCPTLAKFNHSCLPNTHVEWKPSGYRMVAAEDIQPGEEITFSYQFQPVGLVSDVELDFKLFTRFGFNCQCDLHRGKKSLFRKMVKVPTELHMLYHKNPVLESQIRLLDRRADAQDWDDVRIVCEDIAARFFPLISKEPKLGKWSFQDWAPPRLRRPLLLRGSRGIACLGDFNRWKDGN